MPHMVDKSTWTVEILADFFEERLNQTILRYEERYNQDQKAIQAAMTANDKRLDSMNEFRNALADQANRGLPRLEFEAQIRAVTDRFDQTIAPMQEKLSSHGKTNWPLLTGFVSVVFGVLGGCWVLIGLQINVAETPMALSIEQQKATLANAAVVSHDDGERLRSAEQAIQSNNLQLADSKADRFRLNDRVQLLEQSITAGRTERLTEEARLQTQMAEINTQFQSVTNMIAVNNERINQWLALLWPRAFPGSQFPRGNYTATIARKSTNEH